MADRFVQPSLFCAVCCFRVATKSYRGTRCCPQCRDHIVLAYGEERNSTA